MNLPLGLDAKSIVVGALLVAVVLPFVSAKLAARNAPKA